MSSAEQNMFTYLGVSPILIPTIKKHIGNGYHHLYSFFYSSFATGVSPFLFPCMEETVALLIKGIQQKACFYIIGDKDADGVSAISILQTYLLKQNCRVYYNTPLDNETYGTSPRMLQDILSKKEEIYAVLTVDTGIKEHEFALELKKIGIPLVITDHHTPDSTLPETPYIINPHLYKNTFFPICGAYVALKLVQGLFLAASKEYHTRSMSIYYHPEKNILHYTPVLPHLFAPRKDNFILSENTIQEFKSFLEKTQMIVTTHQTLQYLEKYYSDKIRSISYIYTVEELEKKYQPLLHPKKPKTFYPQSPTYGLLLFAQEWIQTHKLNIEKNLSLAIQIAGIATICDRMPMKHFENRGIVKTAYQLFFKDKNHPFYPMLKSQTSLSDFTTNIVPMQFCPLLNAGGRLGKANLVVDFLSASPEIQKNASQKLNELNKERQKKQKIGLQEVESFLNIDSHIPYILYASENIHKGVTGIIANKISKIHQKPTFILSIQKETSTIVGSARSPFEVHPILEEIKDIFINFGGHQKACGFSLLSKDLKSLESYLATINWEKEQYSNPDLVSNEEDIHIIHLDSCSLNFFQSLELLDPYGEGHQPPIFKTKTTIVDPEIFGKNNTHIKWIPKRQNLIQFIFWNALDSYSLEDLVGSEKWIYFTIHKNTFYTCRYDFTIQKIE